MNLSLYLMSSLARGMKRIREGEGSDEEEQERRNMEFKFQTGGRQFNTKAKFNKKNKKMERKLGNKK